jgi:O-antigen ligase
MTDSRKIQGNVIWERVFAAAFGGWLALALLKLGSPIILNDKTPAPTNLIEILFAAWPVEWGFVLFIPVLALGVKVARWNLPEQRWLMLLPAAWFGWQVLSALQTVDANLSQPTLAHFGVCVLSFFVGLFALGRVGEAHWFWAALLGGFTLVLLIGWHQHFIGLEETRQFFYQQPNWRDYPPEFLRKISSNRIYATLFYPNALAGIILLLTPPWLWAVWRLAARGPTVARWTVIGAALLLPTGCLVCSGSKAGWLIFVAAVMAGLWHARISRQMKWGITVAALALALGGFVARYSGYFTKGATSVTARADYWQAAVKLTTERPWLGSGPGTFRIGYKRLKSSEAEMTRLVHNDYLQQACDSGIPGLLFYSAFVFGSILWLHGKSRSTGVSLPLAVWIGVAAFAVQSLVEFGLYIPALAWTFFALLGWAWGSGSAVKTAVSPESSRARQPVCPPPRTVIASKRCPA